MQGASRMFAVIPLLLVACAPAGAPYDEGADPRVQLDEALATAAAAGKPVLVEIGGNWCPDALRLDAFYESHPKVRDELGARFVHVRINRKREGGDEAFFGALPSFSWVPTLMILDASGEAVRVAEATEFDSPDGYRQDELLAFLHGATQ